MRQPTKRQLIVRLERAGKSKDYITGYLRGWTMADKRFTKEKAKQNDK